MEMSSHPRHGHLKNIYQPQKHSTASERHVWIPIGVSGHHRRLYRSQIRRLSHGDRIPLGEFTEPIGLRQRVTRK